MISADLLTANAIRLSEPKLDGDDIYWLESRPTEQGRNCIVRQTPDGEVSDVTQFPLSVRTKAHEYGGGHYCVVSGVVYFVIADDQRIYQLNTRLEQAHPEPLTPEGPYRYADLHLSEDQSVLLCVREHHTQERSEPISEVVAIALDGSERIRVLAGGADFYSNPRLSPDGTELSWLCWRHPHMPWDETECWLADINLNKLQLNNARKIAGGDGESLFQPQWSPSGELYMVSDRNNWWNLYRYRNDQLEPVYEMEAEFGLPQWVFGMSTYGFLDKRTIVCTYSQNGSWNLAIIDLAYQQLTPIECDYSEFDALHVADERAVFIGGSPTRFAEVALFDGVTTRTLAKANDLELDEDHIAKPEPITFTTSHGENAHAFLYQPTHALSDALPPLITIAHGGPTGATSTSLNLKIQYWANRGFAVLDVNYRGSTGYGRAYRDRLKGQWGVIDVDDVCAGAQHVANAGVVNPSQLIIKGSSAGGYTVLAALTFRDTFHLGCVLYGIGDLVTLATDTHKFESRYLDSLIGPYPEAEERYQQRSPIHHTESLNCPVIFFQGLEDKVVPPNQAEAMVSALKAKGITTEHITYPGEGHGFRQASTIKQTLENELAFYQAVFNLPTTAVMVSDEAQEELETSS